MDPTTAALLDTLALCREQLPPDTHPIILVRLQVLERLITHAVAREPQLWATVLARVERAVDQTLAERQRDGE